MQIDPFCLIIENLDAIIDDSLLLVAPETPVLEAIAMMAKYGKGVLVKSDLQLLGYLTQQDVVELVAVSKEIKNTTIQEVMQTPVMEIKLPIKDNLFTLISQLQESQIKLWAVLDQQGELKGTVSPDSVFQAIAQTQNTIDQRQNIENQILPSPRMWQLIIDTIPHRIFWKNVHSRFWGCNRKFAQMLGYENTADIVGKTDYDLVADREVAEFYRAYDDAIMQKNQAEHNIITSYEQADGSQIWLETNKVPLLNNQGQVMGMLGIMADVTERIQAQTSLAKSEQSFRFLAESIPQQVWIAKADGSLEYVNQRTLNYFGCTPERVLGTEWLKFVHPDDLSTSVIIWHQCLATGRDYEVEFRLLETATRNYRWHLVRALPLRDSQGKIINWFGTNTDIHDRITAEIKQRETEQKYQKITTVSPVGIFRCDPQGYCTYVNNNWTEMTGLDISSAMGFSWIEALHPEDKERVIQEFLTSVNNNHPFRSEYRFLGAEGKITWVLGQAIPELVENEKVISYIGTFTDITDFKKVESELAEKVKLANLRAEIDNILAHAENLTSMMRGCTDALVTHLEVAFARIWILNRERKILELQVSSGIYTHINGCHSHIAIGRLKIGLIASQGEPHCTNSLSNDPYINDKEWAKREKMKSFAGYPLTVDGEVIGVIAMFSQQPMTENTFTALGIVANEIAIGIKRKQTEAALKESEERFRNLVETTSDCIWEMDENYTYTYISPKITEILGYQYKELLGKTTFDLMPPAEAERFRQILLPIISENKSFKCLENTNLHKDGHLVFLETSGIPIFNAAGKFVGYRGIARDITIRKQEADILKDTQQRLQAILDNLPAFLYVLDTNNRYLLINKQFEKIFHIRQEQIIGKSIRDIWPQQIAEQFIKNNSQVINGGLPIEIEELVPHQDVLHTHLSIKFPLKNKDGVNYAFCGISTDITERKLAEKSLLRLQKAIESTSDAISITDITGQAIYVNPAFKEIFDYTEQQLNSSGGIKANFRNQNLFKIIFNTVQKGQSWRGEVVMKTKNGEDVQIDLRTDAIQDSEGNIVSFVSIYTDITQTKIIEEGIRLRDRAMAATGNGVVIADVTSPGKSVIIYVNPAFERITGYKAAEILGENFPVVKDIEVNQQALIKLKEAMETGKNCTVILRNYSHNNSQDSNLFWHELSISPVYDVYGSLTHYIGIQTDITEHKQTETELLISKERLQYLLTASPAVIYTSKAREDFGAIFISNNIKAMVGYEAQEFLRDSEFWYSHIHPDDAPLVIRELSQVLEKNDYSLEYRFLHQDGNYRWVYDQGKVVWDEFGNPLERVGYWADITNRKQLEQDLITALEKEKELNELKSRFISMTSHEFRTPLSTILSSAELLEHYRYKWSEDKQLTHLRRIETAVHRMTEMLDDILISGKAEAGKLEYRPISIDLVQYCYQLVEEVKLNVKNQHFISFRSEEKSLSCYMDEKLLRHILTNLLSNAIKYSADNTLVNFTLFCHDEQIIFEIEDQGIGIPQEDLPHLFESFYRARNVGNILGTGLGLAIV
ncbi:MAG: PAS domain S-box protein, partial [Nostocales cyanobacterium]